MNQLSNALIFNALQRLEPVFRLVISIVFLSLTPFISAAQHLRFQPISVNQGLSQPTVFDLLQDKTGFIWVATQNGLNRFDGYQFRVFRRNADDPRALSDDFVNTLFQDSRGIIWVGTRNGLNAFDPATENFKKYFYSPVRVDGISHNYITSITEDRAGFIWIGTAGGGINRYDVNTDSFTSIRAQGEEGLINDNINQLMLAKDGMIWVASGGARLRPSSKPGGINLIDPTTLQVTRFMPPQAALAFAGVTSVLSMAQDAQGQLWIGTAASGLFKIDSESKKLTRLLWQQVVANRSKNPITAIQPGQQGDIWLTTQYTGLYRFWPDSGRLIQYQPGNAKTSNLNDHDLVSLMLDKTGILWVGSWSQGINRLDFGAHQFRRLLNDIQNEHGQGFMVRAIGQDQKNNLWAAIWDHGLAQLDAASGELIKHHFANTQDTGNIREVVVGAQGQLWLGSDSQGLISYYPQSGLSKYYRFRQDDQNSLSHNHVMQIEPEPSGNLWIATRGGGLNYFDQKTQKFSRFRHVPNQIDSLASDLIGELLLDNNGILWIGTEGKGLDLLDTATGKIIAHYRAEGMAGSLPSDNVNSIYQDSVGRFWLGSELGLTRVLGTTVGSGVNNLKFELVDPKGSGSIDGIGDILEDAQGMIWVSSFDAISRVNPEIFEVVNYKPSNGTLSGGYFIRAGYKGKDGTLYFGGVDGMSAFNPREIQLDKSPPTLALTELRLFNKPINIDSDTKQEMLPRNINWMQSLTLESSQNVFSLEFSALHYALPAKNKLAYQLEGFDLSWNYTDAKNRRATYTNLDPGRYRFFLKGSNKDDVWSEPQEKLAIVILPPLWQTNAAYLIYLLLAMLGISAIKIQKSRSEKLRNDNLRAQMAKTYADRANELKSKFLANMSHEIRTPMNAVIGLSELALDQPMNKKLREYLVKINRSSSALLGIINDVLDYSKIEADKIELESQTFVMESVVRDVLDVVSISAQEKKLELLISGLEEIDYTLIGDPLRLRQILINLISNAIKFTERGVVELRFEKLNKAEKQVTVKIEIIDSGIGLSREQMSKIFSPFVQGEQSTARHYGGTGLGLSLSRQLVALMGGQINVASQEGRGTTFSFCLNFSLARQSERNAGEQRQGFSGKLKFSNAVLIDDNRKNLTNTAKLLARLKINAYPLFATKTLQSDLRENKLDWKSIDLVLLDDTLPENDARDIADLIRAIAPQNDYRLLLMSQSFSESSVNDPDSPALSWLDGTVKKPVTPSSLYDQLLYLSQNESPKKKPSIEQAEPATQQTADFSEKRVLVVEDNFINQQVAREIIGAYGVQVDCAENGLEAIEKIRSHQYHLVFMDVQMPVMDGREATRILRSSDLKPMPVIIAMTAHAMAGDREKYLATGMDDYLSKPISKKSVFKCLKRWLPQGGKTEKLSSSNSASESTTGDSASDLLTAAGGVVAPPNQPLDQLTLDIDGAMEALDHSADLYAQLAQMFIQQYQTSDREDSEQLLGQIIGEKKAFKQLQGLAASVGANSLHQLLVKLDLAKKDNSDGADIMQRCVEELERVCRQLQRFADNG